MIPILVKLESGQWIGSGDKLGQEWIREAADFATFQPIPVLVSIEPGQEELRQRRAARQL